MVNRSALKYAVLAVAKTVGRSVVVSIVVLIPLLWVYTSSSGPVRWFFVLMVFIFAIAFNIVKVAREHRQGTTGIDKFGSYVYAIRFLIVMVLIAVAYLVIAFIIGSWVSKVTAADCIFALLLIFLILPSTMFFGVAFYKIYKKRINRKT